MKKAAALEQIDVYEDCPEFQEVRAIKAEVTTSRQNQASINKNVHELDLAKNKAVAACYNDITQESFDAFTEALAKFKAAEAARDFLGSMGGYSKSITDTPESASALLDAIQVLRGRLAKRIDSINETLSQQIAAAGLPATGEHPAVGVLRDQAERLKNAADYCESWLHCETSPASGHPWTRYIGLLDGI